MQRTLGSCEQAAVFVNSLEAQWMEMQAHERVPWHYQREAGKWVDVGEMTVEEVVVREVVTAAIVERW